VFSGVLVEFSGFRVVYESFLGIAIAKLLRERSLNFKLVIANFHLRAVRFLAVPA
jgi:hypothetical protein